MPPVSSECVLIIFCLLLGNPPCSQPVTHNSVISKPQDPLQATVMEDKKTNKKSKPLKRENEGPRPVVPKAPIDVSRLDFRIGKVVRARKHPDADTLYIEEGYCFYFLVQHCINTI